MAILQYMHLQDKIQKRLGEIVHCFYFQNEKLTVRHNSAYINFQYLSYHVLPTHLLDQMELRCTSESSGATAFDSDDSDDIIVSPSRPLRSREVLML